MNNYLERSNNMHFHTRYEKFNLWRRILYAKVQ